MSVLENNETRLFVNNEVAEGREDFYFQSGQKIALQKFCLNLFLLACKSIHCNSSPNLIKTF